MYKYGDTIFNKKAFDLDIEPSEEREMKEMIWAAFLKYCDTGNIHLATTGPDEFDNEIVSEIMEKFYDIILLSKPIGFETLDKVRIVDSGATYDTYTDWIDENFPKLASRYAYGSIPEHGTECIIRGIAPHKDFPSKILYLVEEVYGCGRLFIIESYGVDKI